jgi:arabinose-5-phosphate isomerase
VSRKKLGMTTVLQNGRLAGRISDGDLRRLLERDGSHAHHDLWTLELN